MSAQRPADRGARVFRRAIALNLVGASALAVALLSFTATGLAWRPPPLPTELGDLLRGMPELLTVEQQRAAGIQRMLLVLRGITLVVLAAACANLVFRTLDRGLERRAELRLRAALGATPGRSLRWLLAGSARPIAICVVAGLLLGALLLRALAAGWPTALGRWTVRLDATALLVGAGLPLALVLLCLLGPVRSAVGRDLAAGLSAGVGITAGPFQMLMRRALARAQFTASLGLTVAAGLLVMSASGALRESAGTTVTTYAVGAPLTDAALARVRGLPGVGAAALATPAAWSGEGPEAELTSFCKPACAEANMLMPVLYGRARMAAVSPGHFDTMSLKVLQGRDFTAGDRAGSGAVAVVSRSASALLFPGPGAMGQYLSLGHGISEEHLIRVVGIVEDVHVAGLATGPGPLVYLSAAQVPSATLGLAVRGAPPGEALAAAGVAVRDARPLAAYLGRLTESARWTSLILAGLALVGVVLCAYSLHEMVATSMAARTREIGLRVALGATPGRILRMALGESLAMARAGTLMGVFLALALAAALRDAFAGVPWMNARLTVACALGFTLVALVAAWRPARRAAATEPRVALVNG